MHDGSVCYTHTNRLRERRCTMDRTDTVFRGNLMLFALAALLTFGFITLLQFIAVPWFFLVLIAMHGGIALFIVSKRRFKKTGFSVSRYYKTQYIMLIPYLLIMFYAFATRAGIVPAYDDAKMAVTLAYSAFCAVLTVWNFLRMKKDLADQYDIIIEGDARESLAADQAC